MLTYALQVHSLNFHFETQSTPFFKDFSLDLEEGKIHRLKGKNGTGKSTLFSLLRGDLTPTSRCTGKIQIGQNQFHLSPNAPSLLKGNCSLVNQRFDRLIADQFTFEENLQFAQFSRCPSICRSPTPLSTHPHFIRFFGIDKKLPARMLSGGQRQILALSMVLQNNPRLVLLDEPTATLDPQNARLVLEFLKEISNLERTTFFMICHDDEIAEEYTTGSHYVISVGDTADFQRTLTRRGENFL